MEPYEGVVVQRSDKFAKVLNDHQLGQLAIWRNGLPGWEVLALVRSDATPEQDAQFVGWVRTALAQLAETGDPSANGWFASEHRPDRWYMTCTLRYLPSPD